MEQFLNAIKARAAALDRTHGQPRFGVVTSIDPARYAARVRLQPEDVQTGWLPVLSARVGAGWGIAALPSPGDQVLVLPQDGEAEHGVIVGSAFSDRCPPPATPAGEIWLVHQSGSRIALANDGTIRIVGDLYVAGSIYASENISDATGALGHLRSVYNGHTHPPGGTPPSPQDS